MSPKLSTKQFPNAYREFLRLFNDGQYWLSHEVLEGPWRQNRSLFYKGLIIYSSVFVHAQRGNPRGVTKQLAKARRYLQEFTPGYMGLDLQRILRHMERCEAFVAGDEPPTGALLAETFPYDRLRAEARFVRGDEPELGTN